jgi:CRISPR-associated protein Cas2
MTTRRHFLITYDIADDKRRTAVFNALQSRGDHAQFSVFVCELNAREQAELSAQLIALINHSDDQILFVDLGPAHNPLDNGITAIGKPFQVITRVIVV